MALYQVEAIVLRQRDYREADRIVTLYSREEGKLSALARGTRRPRSRLAAGLQPFAHSRLRLWRGESLDVVTQCEVRGSFPRLRSCLEGMAAATLLAELVDAFSQERDPAPALFALLRGTLEALEQGAGEGTVHAFILGLLALAGYAPRLARCVYCGERVSGPCYFDAVAGGAVCGRCAPPLGAFPLSSSARQVLLHLAGNSPRSAGPLRVSAEVKGEVRKAVLRSLEARLEKRPRTWDFWVGLLEG